MVQDQFRTSPNQVKVRLNDEDYDWLYQRAPKLNGEPNMSGAIRELIQFVKTHAHRSS